MKSLDMLKSLYEHSNVPCGFLDQDMKLAWVNPKAAEIYPILTLTDGLKMYLSADEINEIQEVLEDDSIKTFSLSPLLMSDSICLTKCADGCLVNLPLSSSDMYESSTGGRYLRASMSISNQLRTPINSILSALFSLYYNPQVLELSGVSVNLLSINKGAYALLRATQQLTQYISFSTGSCSVLKEVFDLGAMVYQVVQGVNILLRSESRTINQNIPAHPIYILADPKQVELMLLELISNALKASGDENCHIMLTLKRKNKRAILTIADHGWGMSSEVVDKAFTPFYSYSHTGEPYSGLGLGLTNCRFIAVHNHATIALSSQLEKGTTVAVNFEEWEGMPEDISLNSSGSEGLKNRFSTLNIVMSEISGPPSP